MELIDYYMFIIPIILWAIIFLVIMHCENERVKDWEFTNKKIDGLYSLIHKLKNEKKE